MTVQSTTNRHDYVAAAGQTVFPYSFRIFADTELKFYQAGVLKALITHYTVSGVDNPYGGNVTLVTGATAGDAIAVLRDVDATQLTDWVEAGPTPADSFEDAVDRLTMIALEHEEVLDRALKVPETSTLHPTFPDLSLVANQGKYLYTNASGVVAMPGLAGLVPMALPIGWINVTDFPYNAVGNGVTDDTSAIQAAITAAGVSGGIVYFPPGTYNGTTLSLASNVMLVGAGAGATIIYQIAATVSPVIDLSNKDKVTIRDLTVNGNASNQSQTGVNAGIASSGATNVTLENLLITNTSDWGVALLEVTGATLINVRTTAMRAGANAGATRAGILLGSSAGGTNAVNVDLYGCIAESANAFVNGIMLEKGSNIRVIGGKTAVSYSGYKIKTNHTTIVGAESYGGVQGFQVQDAIQALVLQGNRAHFAGDSGFYFSVPSGTARDWVVNGNIAFDNGQVGASTSYGFAFELTAGAVLDRLVLTSNIATAQVRGISFGSSGSITNVLISGNVALDNTADWNNAATLDKATLTLGPNRGVTGSAEEFIAPSTPHSLQFWIDNVAQGAAGVLTNGISARGYLMPRAGYLRGFHVKSNDAVTAGQIVIQVLKNNGVLGSNLVMTTGTFSSVAETPYAQTFAAGDMIAAYYTANGSLLPNGTADFDVVAEVVYP